MFVYCSYYFSYWFYEIFTLLYQQNNFKKFVICFRKHFTNFNNSYQFVYTSQLIITTYTLHHTVTITDFNVGKQVINWTHRIFLYTSCLYMVSTSSGMFLNWLVTARRRVREIWWGRGEGTVHAVLLLGKCKSIYVQN